MSAAKIWLLGTLLRHLLALIGLFLLLGSTSWHRNLRRRVTGTDVRSRDQWRYHEFRGDLCRQGDRANLRIKNDTPPEFHLHGYDLEEEAKPDRPAGFSVDATTTGRFEIENHDTESVLGALLVQFS